MASNGNGINISPEYLGPIVNIVSWILMVIVCLATLAKVGTKWSLFHRLQADDIYLTAAMVTAIGWVIAVSSQVKAGLGQHISALRPSQLVSYQQAAYASFFLYVLSLCLAKMAILHFLVTLARKDNRLLVLKVVIALNFISMVIGIFAVAFQCPLPHPWLISSKQCFNQTSFWTGFGILDILIDLVTVVMPFFLLHDLQLTWKRKLPAILAFSLRAIIIPIIIVRLIFLNLTANTTDFTFDDFNVTMITSLHVNLSVIVTCLPFLKTISDNLPTGLLAGDIYTAGPSPTSNHALGILDTNTKSNSGRGSSKRPGSRNLGYMASIGGKANAGQQERSLSRSSEERMIINQTTTISVRYAN